MDYREDYLELLKEQILNFNDKVENSNNLKNSLNEIIDVFKDSLEITVSIKSVHEDDVDYSIEYDIDKNAFKKINNIEEEVDGLVDSFNNDKNNLISRINFDFTKDVTRIKNSDNFLELINESVFDFKYWFEFNLEIENEKEFLNVIFENLPLNHTYVNIDKLNYNQLNKFMEFLIYKENECFYDLIYDSLKLLKNFERSSYGGLFKFNVENFYNNLLLDISNGGQNSFENLNKFNEILPEFTTERIDLKKIFKNFDGSLDFYFNKIENLMKIPLIKELFLRDGEKDPVYSNNKFINIKKINKQNLLSSSNVDDFSAAFAKWIYLDEIGLNNVESKANLNKRKM